MKISAFYKFTFPHLRGIVTVGNMSKYENRRFLKQRRYIDYEIRY